MIIAIVPALNEEKRIGSVLRSLFKHVDEVVVIDDGSEDNTVEVASQLGATVLRHTINRGQGAALQTGHEYALSHGADYVLHFDGDDQFSADDIIPAFDKVRESQADILFGSRLLINNNLPWFKRHVILRLAKLFNKIFFKIHLSDAHNGFRILNKRALKNIEITQDKMAHASQIPALAVKNNLKIVEFPVKVTYHEYGQRASGGFIIIKDLIFGRFIK